MVRSLAGLNGRVSQRSENANEIALRNFRCYKYSIPFLFQTDSPKTVEGTVSGIVAQALVLPLFIYLGWVRYSAVVSVKFLFAIIAGSVVETFTDQVDNLVLPLVTFILLSL